MKLDKQRFICVDCETTGLDAVQDRIIEVALVIFDFNTIYATFETLINPEQPIPQSSVEIHHITQEMVADKPTIKEVLPQVLSLIGKHIVVGHGVGFDIDILVQSAKRVGIDSSIHYNSFIDTLRMARCYGESPTNSLEQLRKHFNIELEIAHRAMSDVIVNIEVFKRLGAFYKTTEELFEMLAKPILMKEMPLGKHKGRPMKEIPLEYLYWASNKEFDQDLLFSVRSELKRRKKGNGFSQVSNPFKDL
jgi:DNA polymerase-3 subunit epsilon